MQSLDRSSVTPLRYWGILASVLVLVTGFLIYGSAINPPQAHAATGNILPPFDTGQQWNICQGYSGPVSHTGVYNNSLDLTGAGCDNSAAGRTVRAPIGGTVHYYQASYGNLCINTGDGRSITLTHINSSVTSGAVSAGQVVGTVGAPGQYNNNGVAHIHLQMWSTPNCYDNSNGGIPFDAAHNARICGAPDLTEAGTGTNGKWSGTTFTGASCDSGGGETPNRVALLTPNSDIYAKDGLDSGGWVDQGTRAPTIAVGGSRLALINSDGSVFAKDTLGGGGWINQGAAAKSIAVGFSGRMFIITPDNWVYAKDSLGSGGWINQDAQAIDVAVGQYRAAIINPCGAVYAKDNWGSGGWIQQSECNTAKDVAVSPTGRIAIITLDDHVYAKDSIAGVGGWLDQNATAVQLAVGGNRLMILTPDSHVYAKDTLGAGGWIDQGATAIAIAMTKRGRLVLLNSANRVFAKDDTNGGGWLDQDATASKIAA